MKKYQVVWLGQNDEKGEQLYNQELIKSDLLVMVRRVSRYELKQDKNI